MISSPKNSRLAELIVRFLSTNPEQTADGIWKKIKSDGRACTLQAVYHELKRLQDDEVIVKSKSFYSLSLLWVNDIMNFCEEMYETYLSVGGSLPDEESPEKVWIFRSLLRADEFRLQTRLNVLEQSKEKRSLCLYPHMLTALLRGEQIEKFGKAIQSADRIVYCAVGSRSKLDAECMARLDPKSFVCSSSKGPFTFESHRYIEIIGPYILEMRLDKRSAELTDRLFRLSTGISQISHESIVEILKRKSRIRLSLTYAPKRAGSLEKQFKNYFGIR